jgi:cytosine/adenosine deaminase-related metal-dependent hydrolase
LRSERTIEKLQIGQYYDTTYGTLWKEGPYFPRGTRVQVVGFHIDQGFCVRFPEEIGGEPLEAWEDWDELDFLAAEGTVDGPPEVSQAVLAEARQVLSEAEDGCHLHLQEED